MRIEQLKFLVYVAETKSITHAAEFLHISQQGLSQSINSLEKKLGVTLFKRDANRISLTEEGEKTVENARDILLKYEKLLIDLKPYIRKKETSAQELNIFATPLMSKTILEKIVFAFSHKHAKINVTISEKKPFEIIEEVAKTENAIGLLSLRKYVIDKINFKTAGTRFERLGECGVFASLSKKSPLAAKTILTTKELIKHPIVVYNVEPHIKTIHDLFQNDGVPYFKVATADWEIYRKTISSGLAIGISNCLSQDFLKKWAIVNVPIETSDDFNLVIGYVISTKQTIPFFATEFIEIAKKISAKEYLSINNMG